MNEASAVGLQLVLWATLIASTLMVWIKGRPAVPYSIVPMAIVGIGSTLAVVYAKKRSVEVDTPKNLNSVEAGCPPLSTPCTSQAHYAQGEPPPTRRSPSAWSPASPRPQC